MLPDRRSSLPPRLPLSLVRVICNVLGAQHGRTHQQIYLSLGTKLWEMWPAWIGHPSLARHWVKHLS